MSERPAARLPVLSVLLVLAAIWAATSVVSVAMQKAFTLDEFQWAHAAWKLAEGKVQYRDFFEVHFPFAYQYMSLAFRFGDPSDPTTILTMRAMMLPVLLLLGWGMWRVNGEDGWDWALLAPVMAFTLRPWLARAVEIRHDPMAFALFMGSLACLYSERFSPRVRAFAGGVLLALACWTTQKTFIYGVVFFAALVADLAVNRPRERKCLLVDPLAYLAGSAAVVLVIALGMTINGNWEAFYQWCIVYAAEYTQRFPAFSWFEKFAFMVQDLWWVFVLAGIGIASTLSGLRRAKDHAHPDQLLLLAWFTTWASWALQQAPWPYSAIPWVGINCVFAARGLARLFRMAEELDAEGAVTGMAARVSLGLIMAFTFVRADARLDGLRYPKDRFEFDELAARYFDPEGQNLQGSPNAAGDQALVPSAPGEGADASRPWARFIEVPAWADFEEPQNEYQLRVLQRVGELTDPADVVHDNTGAYVARPSAYWLWYTYTSIYAQHASMLIDEVPRSLEEAGAVMWLMDSRYRQVPRPIRQFLEAFYVPYNGDIWLNGSSFVRPPEMPAGEPIRASFKAMVSGQYFVHPEAAAAEGKLSVGGKTIGEAVFELEAGTHPVVYEGGLPQVSILWLPRNGERWHPNPLSRPHFCCPQLDK